VSAKRLFVSLEIPTAITELLVRLDPNIQGVRWLSPEQMHLTISFLGNVSHDVEEELKKQLTGFPWKAFFLPICGVGKFPTKGLPKVVWIGVGTGHPHLFQLHKRVHEAAIRVGLEPELRSFHPHITLARCRDVSTEALRPFMKSHAAFDAGMIHVDFFCLNSSKLTAAGAIHTHELVVPCRR
jgi:2'-5' RNA ligase